MSGLFARPGPRWFTIDAHRPFLIDLAAELVRSFGTSPEEAAAASVLLPTRRAARDLAEAFLSTSASGAALLPQLRALGDLDEEEAPFEPSDLSIELPPAISPARRRYELAGLVARRSDMLERRLTAESALEVADALGRFLDACQMEERTDPEALADLAEAEHAQHWRISAEFLEMALSAWPARLAELGCMDLAARRVVLMRGLAQRWEDRPPSTPIIAAGSTGSAPAARALLNAIARAPQGAVILPGLDKNLAQDAWDEVGDGHPQDAMKRLLIAAGVEREDVQILAGSGDHAMPARWRRRLVNEALRPPERTADWLDAIRALEDEGEKVGRKAIPEALSGLSLLSVRDEDEAATVCALILRETLETPGRTCALVTPDAALARRVSSRLTRWGVEADVSAGEPLSLSPCAVLTSLVCQAVARPLDPVTLLALVKHPLSRFGLEPAALAAARRRLEGDSLRGLRARDWSALAGRLRPDRRGFADAQVLVQRLRAALELAAAPFTMETDAAPADAARGVTLALEAIATGSSGETGDLWAGAAGEALASALAGLIEDSEALPSATAAGFAELVSGVTDRQVLRAPAARHPRLRILGVLEARLVRSDLTVLAGLEEGVWPAGAGIDPFLSRPMREKLGLPSPERRIGLSAHDFAQAACAPEVVLIERQRRGGSPAVASRWLWRLRTLAAGAGVEIPSRPELLAWARGLDAPLAAPPPALAPAPRPEPRPPVSVRPRELGVTGVELWLRDPYAIYARRILGLRPLPLPDEPMEARLRGVAIHAAFEAFTRDWPDDLPADAETLFAERLIAQLEAEGMDAAALVRERARAENLAPWVIETERARRPGARLIIESEGALSLPTPGGPFRVTARADRIEVRGREADILDFKTGAPPSKKQVQTHLSPQLTLTAAILGEGGFEPLGRLAPRQLVYVRVSGGRSPGELAERANGEAERLAAEALAGLARRVAAFDDVETPYRSWERAQFVASKGDYDHLARVWEWRVLGEAADEGGAG